MSDLLLSLLYFSLVPLKISCTHTCMHACMHAHTYDKANRGAVPSVKGTLLGGSRQDKWLRYEGGLIGPVMAGWFSHNPIEHAGETSCGRPQVLSQTTSVFTPATPFHLNVLADY